MVEKSRFFPYIWHVDPKEPNVTCIRAYGLDENNENVVVRINNFTPYVYLELPEEIAWDEHSAICLVNKITQLMGEDHEPLFKSLEFKKRLYYANMDKNKKRKKFPYLFLGFSTKEEIRTLGFKIRNPINVPGVGRIKMKMHEQDASEILQLTCRKDLPTAGWINFKGTRMEDHEKLTTCDHEFMVDWHTLSPHKSDSVPNPLIMGFDIEVYSSDPNTMPNKDRPKDRIFQISCVLSRQGRPESEYEIALLTLGEVIPEKVGENVDIYMYATEDDLLAGFAEFVREKAPNIIVGYNIFGFDIPYMIDRSKYPCMSFGEFSKMGFIENREGNLKTISWTSSAYGRQEFEFVESEGRLFVDLLPLVKRDYKMNTYSLKAISTYFLGDTKEDLSAKGIFKCYDEGMKRDGEGNFTKRAKRYMSEVGRYCVKDTVLTVQLLEKLQTWIGLSEMAKVCRVQIFDLYTRGQQLKVYSQIYYECMYANYVVEKDGYVVKEDEHYTGAHVFDPVPGMYENVIPFDFCLTGDTLISLSNGTSKRIDMLQEEDTVLGIENGEFNTYSLAGDVEYKGIKDTVVIYMQDSRTITCTPDHKFLTSDNSWVEAKDLCGKTVVCGIDYTMDYITPNEREWVLVVDNHTFHMNSPRDREISLAFSRLIGLLLSDGSIYVSNKRCCCEAYLGTEIDAKSVRNDILLFADIFNISSVNIRKRSSEKKGTTFTVSYPYGLAKLVHKLDGIVVGKRASQPMTLPSFILDSESPLSVIREFLGGLFGGDGCAPYLTEASYPTYGSVAFKWTTIQKYKTHMRKVMSQLSYLLELFDIETTINNPIKIKYANDSIKPQDYKENPRWDYQINILKKHTGLFHEKIGFRYCINKCCRLSIASSYERYCNRIRDQHQFTIDYTNVLIDENIPNTLARNSRMTFADCLNHSRDELVKIEPVIHAYALSSTKDIGYYRGELKRHSHKPMKRSLNRHVLNFKQYIECLGVQSWFSYKGVYAVGQDDKSIPSYIMKVIDVRESLKKEKVYDIEVDKAHNFLGNGVVSHNCSLYPSTIIAYNICWSTFVRDEDDISDDICNIFDWKTIKGVSTTREYIRRVPSISCAPIGATDFSKSRKGFYPLC